MDAWEKLKLDYEQTTRYFHALADVRFKLLALVPILSGAAIAALDPAQAPGRVLALGILGFLVTLGLFFYDQRNTEIYNEMQIRAKSLEAFLGFPRAGNPRFKRGGALLNRPERKLRLFGLVRIWHDRGLAIVYSTTLAAWSYLATGAAAATAGRPSPILEALVPAVVWIGFMWHFRRYDRVTDAPEALPQEAERLLDKPPEEPWLG